MRAKTDARHAAPLYPEPDAGAFEIRPVFADGHTSRYFGLRLTAIEMAARLEVIATEIRAIEEAQP